MYPERVRLFESTFYFTDRTDQNTLKILIADIRRHNLIRLQRLHCHCFPSGKKAILNLVSLIKRPISPLTIHVSEVEIAIALILEESSMIERTFAQVGPTSVTIPTSPLPARTFMLTSIPSLLPLSIVNVPNQFPASFPITWAAVFSYSA